MDVLDVLKYGHLTVLGTLERVPQANWLETGVCGVWSVRDILAHLSSYECLLLEALAELEGEPAGPTLTTLLQSGPQAFNDLEVGRRQSLSPAAALAEYEANYNRSRAAVVDLPEDRRRVKGLFPWYGDAYDFEDMIIYAFYAHKREHMAEVNVFRDRLSAA